MKLISCYIEGFGKLQDFKVDFQDDVTVFMEDNAWGKSTLATFIKVMFYGFSGEGKKALADREREKYRPWNKGVYGGRILFELSGKEYELRRVFGNKEKDDSANLYDVSTNLPSKDFTVGGIGQELFGIDEASFLRTVFVAQNGIVPQDLRTGIADDISAKIGNLSDATDDINNYENVMGRLTDEINRLTPKRSTGLLKKIENEIAVKQNEVREGENLEHAFAQITANMEAEKENRKNATKCLKEVNEEFVKVGQIREKLVQKEQYHKLLSQAEESKDAVNRIKEIFPAGVPKEEDLDLMLAKARKRDALVSLLNDSRLTTEEVAKFEKLTATFAQGYPEQEQLADCRQNIDKWNALREESLAKKMTVSDEEKLKALKEKYPKGMGNEEQTAFKIAAWNSQDMIIGNLGQKEISYEMQKKEHRQKEQMKKSLLILGILLLLSGGVLLGLKLMDSTTIPVVIMIAGILFAVIGCIIRPAVSSVELAEKEAEIAHDKKHVEGIREEVVAYLEQYGISCPMERVEAVLYDMKQDYIQYQELCKKEEEYSRYQFESRLSKAEQEIKAFLQFYYPDEASKRFTETLNVLERESEQYASLRDRQEKYQALWEEEKVLKEELNNFVRSINAEEVTDFTAILLGFKQELALYNSANSQFHKDMEALSQFMENNDVEALLKVEADANMRNPDEIHAAQDELNRKIEETDEAIHAYRIQADTLSERIMNVAEAEERLEELVAVKAETEKKYHILDMTKQYLKQAKEAQTARYVAPIKNAFTKYYHLLTEEVGDEFRFDANINITKDEEGGYREIRSLSSGWQDLIRICERMALVDAMYQDEKPFLVFDDPFVNLDAKKLSHARAFLDEIAKEYQVLYFTCHESRV